ncbi:acid protease [Obba rivulosa]|uniref:Acid protease n=1 Tax=Obba rivulosa TaxID=1052685 RepID=A0A8E2J4S6_9APHY|nr:acid protease [Obba rivulosa]
MRCRRIRECSRLNERYHSLPTKFDGCQRPSGNILSGGEDIRGAGFSIPFRRELGRRDPAHSTSVNFTASTTSGTSGDFQFGNLDGIIYVGTVVVDGQSFEVQLDTGSSDLWLDTTNVQFSSNVTGTEYNTSVQYLDTTEAAGPILLGPVQFGDFVVQNQAFLSAPGTNATTDGDRGLFGIGPPSLSQITQTLDGTSIDGYTLLDNIFGLYPDEPNFMSILLSRGDEGLTSGGIFSIGEYPSQLPEIGDAPKFPLIGNDSWTTAMDGVIINGYFLSGGAQPADLQEDNPPDGQVSALLDTGTALALAPPPYVHAMYSGIPGAQFDKSQQRWFVPCDSKVNVSMVWGQNGYPVHPIDTVIVWSVENGSPICAGAFTSSYESGVDFLLGDTFLRNVLAVFDFGYLARVGDTQPFVQLLSVTDTDQAFAEYDSMNNVRIAQALNGSLDLSGGSSGSSNTSAAVVDAAISNPSSSNDGSSIDLSGLTRNTYIIMGLLGGVILLLFGIMVSVCKSSRAKGGYRPVVDPLSKPYESYSESYSTPYGDGGH